MAKILIIEDDPYVQRMYKRIFAHQKYQTELTSTGEEGLNVAKSKLPDLILLDIMLPGLNGIEVLKELKDDPKTKTIPVLMLTNVGEEDIVRQANELGADSYMVKADFTPDQLLAQIKKYLKD